jgi:hypothetical protein
MQRSELGKLMRRNGGPRFAPGAIALPLDDAPTMEPLAPSPSPGRKRPESDFAFTVPTFGLTQADIDAGKEAERYRAELRAWSMLRVCQWCERRFVRVRGGRHKNGCCGRACYLKAYRRRERKRYMMYQRKCRKNRSTAGGTSLVNGAAACQ